MNTSYAHIAAPRTIATILVVAILGAWSWRSAISASTQAPLSPTDRLAVFEEVWKTIADKYYDPSFNGVNWNAVGQRYRLRLDVLRSDEEFYSLLNRMTGELHDAHTRVRSPQQSRNREKRQQTDAGVLIYEVEGTPVIFDVTPDSDAARAGVKPGMIVRRLGDRPFADVLAEARKEVGTSSSERATKILSYLKLIGGEPGSSIKLALTRADGSALDVTLTRRTISAAPQVITRVLPSGCAYIRVNRFRKPVSEQVKTALEKFRDAPGLILDLRANTGGDGKEGRRTAGYFFNQPMPIARIVTRTGKPPSIFLGLVSLPKEFQAGEKGGQLYAGPLVLLVNEGTGSTSELIASAMQELGRAHIIGTQTAGSVLGVLDHRKLRGGGTLAVSEVGFVTPKGERLEGKGVVPNRTVALKLRDLQHQHDAALEEAERYLKEQRRGPSPTAH